MHFLLICSERSFLFSILKLCYVHFQSVIVVATGAGSRHMHRQKGSNWGDRRHYVPVTARFLKMAFTQRVPNGVF